MDESSMVLVGPGSAFGGNKLSFFWCFFFGGGGRIIHETAPLSL